MTTRQLAEIEAAPQQEQPNFAADNFLVDTLQIPVLLPIQHRMVALRFLVVTVTQTALGRIAQRCGGAEASSLRRAALEALQPWAGCVCARVREENSKAMLSLCVAAGAGADADERQELTDGVVATLGEDEEGDAININGNASASYAVEALMALGVV